MGSRRNGWEVAANGWEVAASEWLVAATEPPGRPDGRREQSARQALDQWLRAANADWDAIAGTRNPNGDADLANELVTGFRVVGGLPGCGGS